MRPPLPWHAEARRLRDQGEKLLYIAYCVERHVSTVQRFLSGKAADCDPAVKRMRARKHYSRHRHKRKWRAKRAAASLKSYHKRKALKCPATQYPKP